MEDITKLTSQEVAQELEYLATELAKADTAYYQNDEPYLTDAQYDALKHRNTLLEKNFPELIRVDSPSKKIGAPLQSGFSKIRHRFPMLSLGDVFSLDEVDDFIHGVKRFLNTSETPEFVADPKVTVYLFLHVMKMVNVCQQLQGVTGQKEKI